MSYKIYLNDQTCGSGKTYNELLYMVNNRGRYLLAVDRKEAMGERTETIRSISLRLGKRMTVIQIKSGDEALDVRNGDTTIRTSRAVTVDVEAVPDRHAMDHVIVIITHEALKLSDLSGYKGWQLVIDETPSIVDHQKLVTTLSRKFFKQHYALDRVGKHFEIRRRSNATPAHFRGDSLTYPLTVMHARVCDERVTVLTQSASWDSLGKEGAWSWTSIWSPHQLAAFSRVTILANAFRRSLTYAVMNWKWPEIEWVQHQRVSLRQYKQRKMTIRFFADAHNASRTLFGSDEGKRRLGDVARWIAANIDPAQHIWTCNEKDEKSLSAITTPKRLKPRQAGSNAYADKTAVSAIYTAKPTPQELQLFQDMGIASSVAVETREFETIFQFVARCAARDHDSEADLTVHVYDRQQAEYLAELFGATGYVTCNVELIDLGFGHTPPTRPGRKPVAKSASEAALAQVKKRELARARKRKQRGRDCGARVCKGVKGKPPLSVVIRPSQPSPL